MTSYQKEIRFQPRKSPKSYRFYVQLGYSDSAADQLRRGPTANKHLKSVLNQLILASFRSKLDSCLSYLPLILFILYTQHRQTLQYPYVQSFVNATCMLGSTKHRSESHQPTFSQKEGQHHHSHACFGRPAILQERLRIPLWH